MTTDSEATARSILRELEESLATHDLGRMLDFWTDDAVLVGDDSEQWNHQALEEYLGVMADMAPTVRWQWETVAPMANASGTVLFAAAGTISFVDASGEPLGEPEPFRVTCYAIEESGRWRLRHFHGSRPAAE